MYEFGVYGGRNMRALSLALNRSKVPFRQFWGFDSFEGLPQESKHTQRSAVSEKEWQAGMWSIADYLGVWSAGKLEAKLKKMISDPRVEFVTGWYNESLTSTVAAERNMRPALFVEVDCDLYISSVLALDWMLSQRLIVPGTLIGYDDILTGGSLSGEAQAHREMVAKYNLNVTTVGNGQVFRVNSVGGTS
jgi:hypothetical protein